MELPKANPTIRGEHGGCRYVGLMLWKGKTKCNWTGHEAERWIGGKGSIRYVWEYNSQDHQLLKDKLD